MDSSGNRTLKKFPETLTRRSYLSYMSRLYDLLGLLVPFTLKAKLLMREICISSEFNPDPTKQATEVLFSCKKSNSIHPQILFNGTVVVTMSEQKQSGLVLDSKLSFEKHLNEKIIKANKNLGIIKHLSRFLPLRTLDQMFKVLVRSHLNYCDIIYHVPSKQDQFGVTLSYLMEKVERIQYQAALAITGA